MRKGKFSKMLSMVLSASLLLGSLPLWGGGKASAETGSFRAGDNLIQLNDSGGYMLTDKGYVSWGLVTNGYDKFSDTPEGEGKLANPIAQMTSDGNSVYVQDTVGDMYYWGAKKTDVSNSPSEVRYPEKVTDISGVDQMQTFNRYNLALKAGDLYLWGALSEAFPATFNSATPTKVDLPGKVMKAQFAYNKTLILLESGDLGYISSTTPTYTSLGQEPFQDFWSGTEYSVALNGSGKLVYWSNAELFPTYKEIANTPSDIKQVSMGQNHFLVLRETGDVMAFGKNHLEYNQLGSTTNLEQTTTTNLLVESDRLPANIVYVSAGFENSIVITADGEVYGWGYNARGNLGLGYTFTVGVPTLIPMLSNYFTPAPPKPSAPMNLFVTTDETSLAASWDSVDGATSYRVVINGQEVYSGPNLSYKYTDLPSKTSYVVDVSAVNASGESGQVRQTVTTKDPEKMPAPTNLKADTTSSTATLSWDAVAGANRYWVMVNNDQVYDGPNTSFTVEGLGSDRPYTIYVRAVADTPTGILESEQATLHVVTKKPMSAPTNVVATSTEDSITVSWDAVTNATGYVVTINNDIVYSGIDLSKTYGNLPSSTTFKVAVMARSSAGNSSQVILEVTTKAPSLKVPGQPQVVSTEVGNVKINWPASEGALLYKVLRNGIEIDAVATTEYTDKTAALGESYLYSVKSFDGSQTSGASPSVMVTVTEKIEAPVIVLKPENFVAEPKETSIFLSWDFVENATAYKLMNGNSVIYQGPLTTFNDVSLLQGTTYNYSIVAINGAVVSEAATVSATTLVAQLPYPTNLRVTELAYNKVRLDWDAVEGADEYQITRDGMTIGVPMGTWWSEDSNSIMDGATYTYRVAAIKNGVAGKEALKVVTIPEAPIHGEAPSGELKLKATRVQHDRVGLSWNTVTGATYYDVYQDDTNKIWTGPLNTITDQNVGPQETYAYKVVARNANGSLESNVISITMPAAPQSIMITPSQPLQGTITFDFKVVDGAMYYVERNPQTKYEPWGDGTYRKTYYNSATGETRDEGIVTPVNGKLNFREAGVEPSKDYHYDILAVVTKPDGTEEVVAEEKVDVTTPADGSGVTVPGMIVDPVDPGTEGGTSPTTPTTPGTGGGTAPTTPNAGGSSSGGNSNSNSSNNNSSEDELVSVTVPGSVTEDNHSETNEEIEIPVSFSDVEGSYAKEAILSLAGKGIVKGFSDGTFGGKKKVTRAEFAIFLNRALGYQSTSPYTGTFSDFNSEAWYAPELNSALQNGIIKGFTDNSYRPNAFISREEAAIMLSNVMLKNGSVMSSDVQYEDHDSIASWATESVRLVTQESVMSGYPGNKFMPKRELTREEAAQMIYNLIKE